MCRPHTACVHMMYVRVGVHVSCAHDVCMCRCAHDVRTCRCACVVHTLHTYTHTKLTNDTCMCRCACIVCCTHRGWLTRQGTPLDSLKYSKWRAWSPWIHLDSVWLLARCLLKCVARCKCGVTSLHQKPHRRQDSHPLSETEKWFKFQTTTTPEAL